MRAYEITHPGGPEVLEIIDAAVPVAGPDEVLMKVAAVGINHHDVRERKRHDPSHAPERPGLEASGEVVAVGAGVTAWQVGDKVCALLNGGGYAEYCTVSAAQCLPVPAGLSMTEAASIPETYFTVWSNVFDRGGLSPGETLLAHGGAGGIGVTAIQLAKAFGNPVIVTAGSAEKCGACVELGATAAINHQQEDFVAATLRLTGGRGADVVLDIIGGDYIGRGLRALADDGRLVMLAFPGGSTVSLDLKEIARRRLTLSGSALRPRPLAHKQRIAQTLRARVWPLFVSGQLQPVVHAVLPFEEAAAAHRLMEASAHVGKIILKLH
jgi:putative PIG3 family NAD(P)H quinone oxidoreductase